MRIRKFKDKDAKKVAILIRKTLVEVNIMDYPETIIQNLCEKYSPEHIKEFSRKRDMFVAEEKGKIIGTAGISQKYISNVFVHPDYQRQKIGAALMIAVEDLARQKGFNTVRLDACITAVKFYEKRGYKRLKTILNDTYGTTFEMIKKL
jgi:putative acetyltransferase